MVCAVRSSDAPAAGMGLDGFGVLVSDAPAAGMGLDESKGKRESRHERESERRREQGKRDWDAVVVQRWSSD